MALGLELRSTGAPDVESTVGHCLTAPRPATPPGGEATPHPATPPSASAYPAGQAQPTASQSIQIRVNQVGYATGCAKLALVISQQPLAGASYYVAGQNSARVFLRGTLGANRGAWSARWRYVYPLDFSGLHVAGRFVVDVAGTRSLPFAIEAPDRIYGGLAANAVRFFQAQRDGPNVMVTALDRQPSHLRDAYAAVYRQPLYNDRTLIGALSATGRYVRALGGWFDAGDYLKFVETASFSEVMMLWSLRDYSAGVSHSSALRREARFGLDWLLRMWDQRRRTLYYQVGIGDGNGTTVLGDHDFWRLPQADDRSRARPGSPDYFVANRPVFAANTPGGPISPNLAGRMAAAFGLCAQVFVEADRPLAERCLRAGETIYALANTSPGQLLSTSPHSYYGDGIWQDDMELGAVELYLGTRALGAEDPRLAIGTKAALYLNPAGRWADAYASSDVSGQDTLNVFDLAPLAHYDLIRVLQSGAAHLALTVYGNVNVPTDPASLLGDLHDQLALAARVSEPDPFGLANVAGSTDTVPHALGVAIQSRLYDLLAHRQTFEGLAQSQLDWVLGVNAWGSSFVVGAGTSFPQCLAHPIANLSGSLDGSPPVLLGATVDGPNDPASLGGRGAPDGYRRCPVGGGDRFASFDTDKIAYLDDVTSSTTSEPADDYAALALLAFAQAAHAQT